jgi:predicted esterase
VPTRRCFLAASALAALLAGCAARLSDGPLGRPDPAATLDARPPGTPVPPPVPGTRPLGLQARRDALLHVPADLVAGRPVPLVVTLHGAGGDAEGGLALLRTQADERGLVLLAPASGGSTWDGIQGSYGPDVDLLDRALDRVSSLVAVDLQRTAIAGFSDGASYALGLGLANGAVFRRVIAFSPGFVPPGAGRSAEQPEVFVSHGDADRVLPIDRTSRRVVPRLREQGYAVTYREFAGPHAVPPEIAREAVDWLGWDGRR